MRTAKDDTERNKIEFQLKAPPPWQKKPRAADQKVNANNFVAGMAALQAVQGTGS